MRLFRAAAGLTRDEPIGAHVYALYVFLSIVAMMLFLMWVTGAPIECVVRATC